MIEHRLSIAIDASNARVWNYVSDMANWASNMPGYREFEVINERESLWTLKVGVAALVRTVRVRVNINVWDEPSNVAFTYKLDNDPVDGDGTYVATPRSDGGTNILLQIRINGQGPMAPAWEAMARPILPRLAGAFGQALKLKIEEREMPFTTARSDAASVSVRELEQGWVKSLWNFVLGFFRRAV